MIGIRRSEITEANDAGPIAANGSEPVVINGQRCEVREVESLVNKIVRVDRKRSVVRRIQSPVSPILRAFRREVDHCLWRDRGKADLQSGSLAKRKRRLAALDREKGRLTSAIVERANVQQYTLQTKGIVGVFAAGCANGYYLTAVV